MAWIKIDENLIIHHKTAKLRKLLGLKTERDAMGHVVALLSFTWQVAWRDGDLAAYEAAGLSCPTKFNLGETFELDFNDEWFSVPAGAPYGQTPKLGILHPSLMRRAKAALDAAAGTG